MSCRLKKAQFSCPHPRRKSKVQSRNKNKSFRRFKKNLQAEADKIWPRVVLLSACLKNEHNPCQKNPALNKMLEILLEEARFDYMLALNDGVPF